MDNETIDAFGLYCMGASTCGAAGNFISSALLDFVGASIIVRAQFEKLGLAPRTSRPLAANTIKVDLAMPLLDFKRSKSVTNKCHFRLRRNDYGKQIRHTLNYACEQAWITILPHLRPGEPWGDLIIWEAGPIVSVRPACSSVDESNRRFERCHGAEFTVLDYRNERKAAAKCKDAKEVKARIQTLDKEFGRELEKSIAYAFQLNSIQALYLEYNPNGRPFSILWTHDDKALQSSVYNVVWKNPKGMNAAKLRKTIQASKGRPLPNESREPSRVERASAKFRAQTKVKQKAQKKTRAAQKQQMQDSRARMASQRLPAKSFALTPDIRFGSGTIDARCRKAWLQLFAFLYKRGYGAQKVDLMVWELDSKRGEVRLTPRSSNIDESNRQAGTKTPSVSFRVVEFAKTRRKTSAKHQRAGGANKTQREFRSWLEKAITLSFHSDAVQVEYSWFNDQDLPFSVLCTAQDQGLRNSELKLLLSEYGGLDESQVRAKQECLATGVERREKRSKPRANTAIPKTTRKAERRKSTKLNAYAAGWSRFYYDDGKKRLFWYVRLKANTQFIVQGKIGELGQESTRRFKTPRQAKAETEQLIQTQLGSGYLAYTDGSLMYARKNRLAKKLVEKAIKEFEKQHGAIPEELRRYLLSVNGGRPKSHWIATPAHKRFKRLDVGIILGFKAGQMVCEIPYCMSQTRLPSGHIAVAEGEHLFSIDPAGAIHFWDMEHVDKLDCDDDGVMHLDRVASYVVAHSFDEFLTRLERFPNDTDVPVKVITPAAKQARDVKLKAAAKQHAAEQPLRRFYLDDGKSRKYWICHIKGKTITIRFGRLGAKGTETKKSFASIGQAAANAAKQIERKQDNGYQEVVPGLLLFTRAKGQRLAKGDEIDKLEQQLGAKLPTEYRHFLLTQNGGVPRPGFIKLPGVPHIDNVNVDFVFGLSPKSRVGQSLAWAIDSHLWLPKGHLPIAAGSDIFTLSLQSKPGCVYFWDHEAVQIDDEEQYVPSTGHLAANSFDEFLTRIAEYSRE